MLRYNTVAQAVKVAESLDCNLTAKPNTLLSGLCLSTYQAEAFTGNEGEGVWEAASKWLEDATRTNMDGVQVHDEAIKYADELIAGGILASINTAKNTVNPMIKEVLTTVREDVNKSLEEFDDYHIEVVDMRGGVWGNPIFQSLLQSATEKKNVHGRVELRNIRVSQLTLEEYEALFNTGSKALDDLLREELPQEYVSDTIGRVWDGYAFVHNDSTNPEDTKRKLLAWLTAKSFRNELPQYLNTNQNQIPNSTIQYILEEVEKSALWSLAQSTRKYEREVKNKILFVPGMSHGKLVTLNKTLYDVWTDSYTPDAIYGAVINNSERSWINLEQKREMLEKVYASWVARQKAKEQRELEHHILRAIRNRITNMINEDQDIEHKEAYHERLTVELSNVVTGATKDAHNLIRRVVCNVFHPNSNAEQILANIDELHKEQPETDINELALIAGIYVITDHVADMIGVG